MGESWDPAPETVTAIRRRLLNGASSRELTAEYPVSQTTIETYAHGSRATPGAEIGPVRALAPGTSIWVRVEQGVPADD